MESRGTQSLRDAQFRGSWKSLRRHQLFASRSHSRLLALFTRFYLSSLIPPREHTHEAIFFALLLNEFSANDCALRNRSTSGLRAACLIYFFLLRYRRPSLLAPPIFSYHRYNVTSQSVGTRIRHCARLNVRKNIKKKILLFGKMLRRRN